MPETPESPDAKPVSAGEARKATQSGQLPIGTVEAILKKAPEDLTEEIVEIPEWECSVKLRSFSAAQSSRIKQIGFAFRGESTDVAWAEMEKTQFREGVIEPTFSEDEVNQLHFTSGLGFARVIAWLDEHSNVDKEALKAARDQFSGSEQPADV